MRITTKSLHTILVVAREECQSDVSTIAWKDIEGTEKERLLAVMAARINAYHIEPLLQLVREQARLLEDLTDDWHDKRAAALARAKELAGEVKP